MKFAKQEKIALIFLLASLFVGEAALYYKKVNSRSPDVIVFEENIDNPKKVNINEAKEEELVRLNRIGPVLAGRIISYREKYGPFRRAEELKKVKGIGDKAYEKIKEQIILE